MGLRNDTNLQNAFTDIYAKNGNISETCREIGVGRDTVYRLVHSSPEFKGKLETARSRYLSEMATNFQSHAPEALEALLAVIHDDNAPSTAKVQAAGKIIDYSKDWGEAAEMEARIAELQQDIAEAEGRLA